MKWLRAIHVSARVKRWLLAILAVFAFLSIAFLLLFLVARSATQAEWDATQTGRTPAMVRGLVDAMTKYSSEPANVLPLSAQDDEVCAAAVVNAVNFILGEEKLKSAPAWSFSQKNAEQLERVYNREDDFKIENGRIVEIKDTGFQLSKMLDPGGLYILGYHYIQTVSDHKIIAADVDLNSHLMLLLGKENGRWYGYHLIHYPNEENVNPVKVERIDLMPEKLDLVYIWQVKGVEIPEKGDDLFMANTSLSYSMVRPWLNWGPNFLEYYLDTVSVWLLTTYSGTGQFPKIFNLGDQDLVEIPKKGSLFHGRIMGFYKTVPIYFHGGDSRRGIYGLEFQCVELINRFLVSLGHRNLERTGHADSYLWDADSKGLKSFLNGGPERPRINDVLVFDTSDQDGDPGHVAIIYSVTDKYVCFVQQNVGKKWRDCFPMKQTLENEWNITIPAKLSNICPPVAGWARIK